MALARALVQLLHKSTMYFPGDTFEYEGKLKDPAVDGMEWVTVKSSAAFMAAQLAAHADLVAELDKAKAYYDDVRGQLSADPSRGDLVALVLEAETKVQDAQAAADAAMPPAPDADLV